MSEGQVEIPKKISETIDTTQDTPKEIIPIIDVKDEVQQIQAEIKKPQEVVSPQETKVESEVPDDLGNSKDSSEQFVSKSKPVNPVRSFLNTIKYPSQNDRALTRDKIIGPAFAASLTGATAISLTMLDSATAFFTAHPNLVLPYFGSALASIVVGGPAFIGSMLYVDGIAKRERKNSKEYSKLLTVSKVFTKENSLISPMLRKIDPWFKSGFTGELHFVGKDQKSWEGIADSLSTLRDGAAGLYNLATACEQNDPNLEGVDYFGGLSPMLNPQFEKFGFKVAPLEEVYKKPFISKVMDVMAQMRAPTGPTHYPNGQKIERGHPHIAVISRKALIEHKLDYAKFAKIKV